MAPSKGMAKAKGYASGGKLRTGKGPKNPGTRTGGRSK